MALILSEEQKMLKNSAKELFKAKGNLDHFRALRDEKSSFGYDDALWKEMAQLGFSSINIPESYGGMEFGVSSLAQILEEAGRTLIPSPLISTVLLSATAINLGGSEDQKNKYLALIANSEAVISFALEEGLHHNPNLIDCTASKNGASVILNGNKKMVLDGHVSDYLIVAAKNDEGEIRLFILDSKTEGVSIERKVMMDNRNSSNIEFKNVEISLDSELKNYVGESSLLDEILASAYLGLASEMLGGMQEAFERTVDYLKQREQFGVKIGTFQALQHRAAEMFCQIELCKSIVIKAAKAIDENKSNRWKLASLAKAKCGQVYKLVSNEAIQMFGGIGMTDDENIGFFLKRARVAQQTFGDTNFHLDRLAKMKGY